MAAGTALYQNPPYFRNGRVVESRPWHNRLNAVAQRLTARRDAAFANLREYRRIEGLLMRVYMLTPDQFAYSNVGEENWNQYLLQDARIRYAAVKAECGIA